MNGDLQRRRKRYWHCSGNIGLISGIFAVNMTDIDAMGIPDPEGHHRHTDDWKSDDGRKQVQG